VDLDASLQWRAFQRLVRELCARGNSVLVVVGPFNEHMVADENRAAYFKLRDGVTEWLKQNRIPNVIPDTLPGELYADASHPLTRGYQVLGKEILSDPQFQNWLK
jgi:hypothetical protein